MSFSALFYRGQLHQVTQKPCLVDCCLVVVVVVGGGSAAEL